MKDHKEYIQKYELINSSSFSIVDSSTQKLYLYQDQSMYKEFIISTALNGLGEENMSFKTPRGLHQIKEKIGDGLEECSILKARVFTGEVWSEQDSLCSTTDLGKDLVLTRVLWLDGLEEHNQTSFNRYIYIHGTNDIKRLGSAHSEGCIRMSNKDVIAYFNFVETKHLIVII